MLAALLQRHRAGREPGRPWADLVGAQIAAVLRFCEPEGESLVLVHPAGHDHVGVVPTNVRPPVRMGAVAPSADKLKGVSRDGLGVELATAHIIQPAADSAGTAPGSSRSPYAVAAERVRGATCATTTREGR